MKSSSYYFHMKTKILADSQICISVTLSSRRSICVHEYLTGCILLLQVHVIRDGYRSSRPDVFLGKGVLKICSKLTGEDSCRSAISIKLQSNFYAEVALQLYWNHTSAWVFSCQFAAYFQTTFLQRTRLDCCFFVLWKVYNWAQNWLDSI